MFARIHTPARLKRPSAAQRAQQQRENAARIWEAARIAEKFDNYAIPTPDGFEVRYNGKLHRITGEQAARIRAAVPAFVDPADWILYIYSLEG